MITYKDIKDEIMSLGAADSDEFENYKTAAVHAINTAISDLSEFAVRKHRIYTILHFPEDNTIIAPPETLYGIFDYTGEKIEFFADDAKAYSFFCSGNAEVSIDILKNGTWENLKTLKCSNHMPFSFKLYRGFTANEKGRFRMRFEGKYSYKIKSPAFYGNIYSQSEEDIMPFEKYTAYDIRKLTRDSEDGEFLMFDGDIPVCVSAGCKPFDDCAIRGNSEILLPRSAKGVYDISYIACPKFVSESTPDDYIIDLPQDAAKLIALYAASRIFRSEDAIMSESYGRDYENLRQQLYHEAPVHSAWTSYYGW